MRIFEYTYNEGKDNPTQYTLSPDNYHQVFIFFSPQKSHNASFLTLVFNCVSEEDFCLHHLSLDVLILSTACSVYYISVQRLCLLGLIGKSNQLFQQRKFNTKK